MFSSVNIADAITYLNERNSTAAANLDAELAQCIERLAAQEFDGSGRLRRARYRGAPVAPGASVTLSENQNVAP
jgi:hypothetical protein